MSSLFFGLDSWALSLVIFGVILGATGSSR
jgi:hypothetical protein